ncbi:MAG: hypothetical protein V7K14_30525 [Nostoc sp.]
MSDEVVELDFCCPECNCSQWQHDKDNGVYFCARCDYLVALDQDDPDYDDSSFCPVCLGSGKNSVGEECLICQGTGML